jgi:6-pyruvoyltetrahydropterin/6-carboxytetrahydropterin synthase
MYHISKAFSFSASHQLKMLPVTHPCSRLHGHNYQVEVILKADILNSAGFVVDYNDLATLKNHLDTTYDHRHLNEVMTVNPTAENLAKELYDFCKKIWPAFLWAVKVSETEKTWAIFHE